MRGTDIEQSGMFSYVSLESRVPQQHPLRRIRALLDDALEAMHRDFERVYASGGRSSIAPERLVRALVLQVLYWIRSERAGRATRLQPAVSLVRGALGR